MGEEEMRIVATRRRWVLTDEWLFQIFVHKGDKRIRVSVSNIDERDQVFARGLAALSRAWLRRRTG